MNHFANDTRFSFNPKKNSLDIIPTLDGFHIHILFFSLYFLG